MIEKGFHQLNVVIHLTYLSFDIQSIKNSHVN